MINVLISNHRPVPSPLINDQLTVRTVARTLQLCAQTGIFLKAWLGLGLVLGIVKSTIFTVRNLVNRKNQP